MTAPRCDLSETLTFAAKDAAKMGHPKIPNAYVRKWLQCSDENCDCDRSCVSVVLRGTGYLPQQDKVQPATALIGGRLIDVSNAGHGTRDIPNAVVVIRAGKIEAAGAAGVVKVPRDSKTIDCRGTYILPGLVDGFGGLISQAQANA